MSKAIIKTEKGDMTVAFYDQDAPNTVANFLKLRKKKNFIVAIPKLHKLQPA